MGACQYFEPRRGTWPAWAGRRRRHRRCRWLTASNLCRRNSERGRNGARHRNSERSFASRAHRRRRSDPPKEAGMAWLPRTLGLHPICSFATLVPVVVSKCAATPRRSHAGLPARPSRSRRERFHFAWFTSQLWPRWWRERAQLRSRCIRCVLTSSIRPVVVRPWPPELP